VVILSAGLETTPAVNTCSSKKNSLVPTESFDGVWAILRHERKEFFKKNVHEEKFILVVSNYQFTRDENAKAE
jgi:hypothetical protein